MVHWLVGETGENVVSFVHAAFLDEPSRGLGEEENETEDDESGCALKCNNWTPLPGIVSVEEEPESNPLSACKTDGTHGTLNHDKLSTTMRLRALGLPSRDGSDIDTETKTRDDTTGDKCTEVERSCLKNST